MADSRPGPEPGSEGARKIAAQKEFLVGLDSLQPHHSFGKIERFLLGSSVVSHIFRSQALRLILSLRFLRQFVNTFLIPL